MEFTDSFVKSITWWKLSSQLKLQPFSLLIRNTKYSLNIFTNWLHNSKRNYPGSSPCGFLLQQGHFASLGNESIMIYSIKWGCCHLADTSSAGRLWLHGNHGLITFCIWAPMEKYHSDKLTKTQTRHRYDWWCLLGIRFVWIKLLKDALGEYPFIVW